MPLQNPCPSNPLITFGAGGAPTLSYNLPQKNSIKFTAYYPFNVNVNFFNLPVGENSDDAYWDYIMGLTEDQIKERILTDLNTTNSKFFSNFVVLHNALVPIIFYESPYVIQAPISAGDVSLNETAYRTTNGYLSKAVFTKGDLSQMTFQTIDFNAMIGGIPMNSDVPPRKVYITETSFPGVPVSEFDINEMAKKFKFGLKGRFSVDEQGVIKVDYFERSNSELEHQFYIIYDTEISSYLGQYGAGQTIRTFSLLPGEKTTLTLKSFKESKTKASKSENIIESGSSAAKKNFQNSIEKQASTKKDNGVSITANSHWEEEASGGLDLGFISFGGGISGGGGLNLNTSELTSALSGIVDNSLSNSVNESNSSREIKITNSTETEDIDRTESTTIREISNPNISRTLNFVFRQLNQEYMVIHWLKNIRFGYNNGNPNSRRVCNANGLEAMLAQFISPLDAAVIAQQMIGHSCFVFNYNEGPIQFFETRQYVKPGIIDCANQSYGVENICMTVRRRSVETTDGNGVQGWDGLCDTWKGITVPGAILSGQSYVLKTDSVIVDALLGQGEALDCYNKEMQNANVEKSLLANAATEKNNLILDIAKQTLEDIDDPIGRADAYKKMFGKCCDEETNNPQ